MVCLAIFQLITLLNTYVIPFIVGLSAFLSFFFYLKTKKKGFIAMGIAFVIQVAYNVSAEALFRYFATVDVNNFAHNADLLSTFGFTIALIFAILLLTGLILLFTEFKPKTTQQLQDAKA